MKKYKYIAVHHNDIIGTTNVRFYYSVLEAKHDPKFIYDELYRLEPVKEEDK